MNDWMSRRSRFLLNCLFTFVSSITRYIQCTYYNEHKKQVLSTPIAEPTTKDSENEEYIHMSPIQKIFLPETPFIVVMKEDILR